MERERLGSRLGFLLLSAGCAIGIGNVWKFPYMCGQYGGGAFVFIYIFFLVVLGVPVMTMEFAVGRASRKSPVKLYDELAPKGSKWFLHGYAAMAGNYILMMFYTTVCGWMVQYFVEMAKGSFAPGQEIPSRRDLANKLKINPNTVQRAYKEMEEQGLIYTEGNLPSRITKNEQVLHAVREELIVEAVDNFITSIRSIQLPLDEVLDLLKEKYEER